MNNKGAVDAFDIFFVLLIVLFIGLKLTGYIDWSWWWVLSPIWLPIAILIGLFVLIAIIKLITRE